MNAETSAATTGPHWREGSVSSWIFATDHKRIGMLWLAVGGLGIFARWDPRAHQRAPDRPARRGPDRAGDVCQRRDDAGHALDLRRHPPPRARSRGRSSFRSSSGRADWRCPGSRLSRSGWAWRALSPSCSRRSRRATLPARVGRALRASHSIRPAQVRPRACMGLFLIALATLLTAVALVATFRGPRAPGLSNDRLPLFRQSAGIFAIALLVLASISLLGNGLLLLDRKNNGTFDWYIDGGRQPRRWVRVGVQPGDRCNPASCRRSESPPRSWRRSTVACSTHRRLVTLALVAAAVLVAVVPSARYRRGQPPGLRAGPARPAAGRGCGRDAPRRRLRRGSHERPGPPVAVRPGIARPA